MSNESHKADQIASHFYTKLFYVVNQARSTAEPRTQPKLDKWFNLETPDSELFTKEAREPYKSISVTPPPPLEIQVLLTVPELTLNQVLVYLSPDSSRIRISPTPRFVLLESFLLELVPPPNPADVALPTIYKHGIPLFRSLYTLLRILPAWKLHKRLRRRAGAGLSLGITLKVRPADTDDPSILSFNSSSLPVQSQTHSFPPVPHPMGTLALSATYLTTPTFQLDDLESLLSSGFLSADERPFLPTLVKNHHRDSSLSSISRSTSNSPSSRSRRDDSSHAPLSVSRSPPSTYAGLGTGTAAAPNPYAQRSTSTSPPRHPHSPPSSSSLSTHLADRFLLPNPSTSAPPSPSLPPPSNPSAPQHPTTTPTSIVPGTRGIPLPLPVRQSASGGMVAGSAGSGLTGSLPRQPLSMGSGYSSGSGSGPGTGFASGAGQGMRHSPSPGAVGNISRPSSGLAAVTRPRLSHVQAAGQGQGQQGQGGHLRSTSSSSLSPSNSFFSGTPPMPSVPLPLPSPPPLSQPQSPIPPSLSPSQPTAPAVSQGQGQAKRPIMYPSPFRSNTLSMSSSSSPILPTGSVPHSHSHSLSHPHPHSYSQPHPYPHSQSGSGPMGIGLPSSLGDRVSLHDRISLSEKEKGREGRWSLDFSPGTGVPLQITPREHAADEGQGHVPSSSMPQRKRYSSSFGHRYVGTGTGTGQGQGLPGSAGSAGSGVDVRGGDGIVGAQDKGKEKEKDSATETEAKKDQDKDKDPARRRSTPSSSTFLTSGSGDRAKDRDDEDISEFVQDIDSARPLVGRGRGRVRERERAECGSGEGAQSGAQAQVQGQPPPCLPQGQTHSPPMTGAAAAEVGTGAGTARSPPSGMMLTSEREVDEKLKRMNEAFLRSLEGLGGGGGGGGSGVSSGGRERTRSFGPQRGREGERESGNRMVSGEQERERERERERTTSLSGRYSSLGYGQFRRGGGDMGTGTGVGTGTGGRLSRARSTTSPSVPPSRDVSTGALAGSGTTNNTAFPGIFRPSSRTGTGVYAHEYSSDEIIGRMELDSESGSGSGSIGSRSRFGRGAGGRFDF